MNNQKPEVSVIIPTYNRARLISRAIQSVLSQSYQNLEIVIVDDGSVDNTEEVIKSFKDTRIVYIRHDNNKGASAARNTGIKASKGKYIAFQDSDDEWFSDKLEQQMKAFEDSSNKVGVVYCGFYRVEAGKEIYIPGDNIAQKDGDIHKVLLKGNFIGTPAVFIKKECFETVKYFDENMPALEDWELCIELSKYYLFKYIDKPLLRSYSTPNSVNLNSRNLLRAREIILANHLNDFSKDKKIISDHYFNIAIEFCSNGDFKSGRNYLINSVKANTLNLKAIIRLLVLLSGQRTYLTLRYIYLKVSHRI